MSTKELTMAIAWIGCFAVSMYMYGEARYRAGRDDMANKWLISEIEKAEKRFKVAMSS